MSQLRDTIMADEERIASKSRFGLFSQPPPLAVGDDGNFKQKQRILGQDGKPISKPRNLLSGTNRSGVGKKGYFDVPQSIYKGDEYQDQYKIQIKYQNKMHTRSGYHEMEFKPASGYKTLDKPAYEYKEQKPLGRTNRTLDENGRVWTQPKNITSNTMSKIQRQYLKNPEYIADPIDRKKELQKRQRQIFKSKLPEAVFKSMNFGSRPFTKPKSVYGFDEEAKKLMDKRKDPVKRRLNTFAHEAPFVPSVKNPKEAIAKYPNSMSAQTRESIRPRSVTEKKEQERWRPNGNPKSRPTPSISLFKKNISHYRYK